MTENIGNILFLIAGLLWGIELIPQLVKTFKSKSVGDFSPFFLTVCVLAYTLFIIGCVLIKNYFLLFSHIIPTINLLILCVLYKLYKNKKTFPPDKKAQAAYIKEEEKCPRCEKTLPNNHHRTKNGCKWCDGEYYLRNK